MRKKVLEFIDSSKEDYYAISKFIWDNPELGHREFKAADVLMTKLKEEGFTIEENIADMKTAFRCTYKGKKEGPTIAFLAEYDALPQLGHGCGHNLIGVSAVMAATALKDTVDAHGGTILVIGTPAEETDGGKVKMVEEGIFNNIDLALMIHPAQAYESSGTSMALEALQFDFYGKPAHGAASPHKGVNALDALVNMYVAISTLRQQLPSDVRIHGIVTKGGDAANIIPDHTQGQFYVRAMKKEQLQTVIEKVRKCAHGAALVTGCTVEIKNYEESYDDMVTNQYLSDLYDSNLVEIGVNPDEIVQGLDHGSLDMGNVSHVVPAIHPFVKICSSDIGSHTKEFANAAGSLEGFEQMLHGIKAMALTAYDIITDPIKLGKL